jgi:hypothetical protein
MGSARVPTSVNAARTGREGTPSATARAKALQDAVHLSQGCKLAQVARRRRQADFPSGIEIAAREEVGCRHYCGAHRPVFVGTLRPSYVAVEPQVKPHENYFTPALLLTTAPALRQVGDLADGLQKLMRMERLLQDPQFAEAGGQFPIGKGRQIQYGHGVFQTLEDVRLIGDQQLHDAGTLGRELERILRIRFPYLVAGASQNAADKTADEGILNDYNYASAGERR